jgi:hypothetical protein
MKRNQILKGNLINFNSFKTSFIRLMILFLILGITGFTGSIIIPEKKVIPKNTTAENYSLSVREKTNEKLIREVGLYIKKEAPASKLDSRKLVSLCEKYQVNVIFVLAQGILESNLGTQGKAISTNSVWNVGAFDDGTIKHRYNSQTESIEPYLILLRKEYLIRINSRGDTISKGIDHLIEDGGYVNHHGKRFATSVGYENALRKYMLRIDMETNIGLYQGIIKMSDGDIEELLSPNGDKIAQL